MMIGLRRTAALALLAWQPAAALCGAGIPPAAEKCRPDARTTIEEQPACCQIAAKVDPSGEDAENVLRFCTTGTNRAWQFTSLPGMHFFNVVNPGDGYAMLLWEPNVRVRLSPGIVRLGPRERKSVTLSIGPHSLSYAVSRSSAPFRTQADRYRGQSDGETVRCVPVAPTLAASMNSRTSDIFRDSRTLVTDKNMPAGTYVYTPGPFYRAAGIFARDFLFQIEGGGRDLVTADEVKRAVDLMAMKQLQEEHGRRPLHLSQGCDSRSRLPRRAYYVGAGDVLRRNQRPFQSPFDGPGHVLYGSRLALRSQGPMGRRLAPVVPGPRRAICGRLEQRAAQSQDGSCDPMVLHELGRCHDALAQASSRGQGVGGRHLRRPCRGQWQTPLRTHRRHDPRERTLQRLGRAIGRDGHACGHFHA